MKHIPLRSFSDKKWIFIFSALAVLCIGTIVFLRILPVGHVAVISKDGEELYRIDLDTVTQSYTIPLDGNVILVEPGKISMQSATCPDKLCVRQGTLQTGGRIVCLPHHVLIEIAHEKNEPDAKVG